MSLKELINSFLDNGYLDLEHLVNASQGFVNLQLIYDDCLKERLSQIRNSAC